MSTRHLSVVNDLMNVTCVEWRKKEGTQEEAISFSTGKFRRSITINQQWEIVLKTEKSQVIRNSWPTKSFRILSNRVEPHYTPHRRCRRKMRERLKKEKNRVTLIAVNRKCRPLRGKSCRRLRSRCRRKNERLSTRSIPTCSASGTASRRTRSKGKTKAAAPPSSSSGC